ILKANVCYSGSWRWNYQNGSGFTVNYQVNTLDLACPIVRLWYSWVWTSRQQQESANYVIRLTATTPWFRGLRWWFSVPLTLNGAPCNRRVGTLHLPPTARYFGCRQCHHLTYRSCQESHKYDRCHWSLVCGSARQSSARLLAR